MKIESARSANRHCHIVIVKSILLHQQNTLEIFARRLNNKFEIIYTMSGNVRIILAPRRQYSGIFTI